MLFTKTKFEGAYIIDIEPHEDERGFFARTWCEKEFKNLQINPRWVQCGISFNMMPLTLRGMHFQLEPFSETKLVRCTMGAIFDVIIDLRTKSPTYRQWEAVELNAANHRALYIPKDFAHGFLTLMENSEVFYQMSEFYRPEYARGVRWSDPIFGIEWPSSPKIISQQDSEFADYLI